MSVARSPVRRRGARWRLALAVLALALPLQGGARTAAAQPSEIQGVAGARGAAARQGRISIIAELAAGAVGTLATAEIAPATTRLRQRLAPAGVGAVRRLGGLPFVALEVTAQQLEVLLASGMVRGVAENGEVRTTLAESGPLVGAPEAWDLGGRGVGQTVVIVDSGVQASHPFFGARVVRSVCSAADCGPNIVDSPGAGEPNPGCDHGTHVAGIAAGRGTGYGGMAPDADIISVRVFECNSTGWEYIIRGLDYVYSDLRSQYRIASVNMSIGDSSQYSTACDDANTVYRALATAIDNLRSAGIAVVASAGNGYYNRGIAAPACIENAIAVGSTTKQDTVSDFSNSGVNLDLLAPGSSIYSSLLNGSFGLLSGTSMAAPHVAGALAAIRAAAPGPSLAQIEQALEQTGKPVTDPGSGITKPRIDVARALVALGVTPSPRWHPWEAFAGTLGSNPECLSASGTETDCWATLSSRALGWWHYDGATAPTLVSLGGQVGSPPSCLHAGGKQHCFATLSSNQLGQIVRTGATWGGWQSLGDNVRRRPACVSPDGTAITCVATNAAGRLRTRTWSGSSWGSWTTVASGVTASEPPTCYARAGGVDCVVADTANRLQYLRRTAGGGWTAATSLGGNVMGMASCIAPATATRTCFIQGTDRTLRRIGFNGTRWGAWENLGGSLYSGPSCVRLGDAETHCFAVAADGQLQVRKRAGSWQPWVGLGGALAQSRPACVAPTGARLDCFARDTGNLLAHIAHY